MPLTADVSAYIQEGIGTWVSPQNGDNPDGNIFESFLPDMPDRACCVYELTGDKPQRSLGGGFSWESPRLRVVNRAPANAADSPGSGSWPMAEADARALWDLLRAVANQDLSGTRYIIVEALGNPQPQGLDVNNRPLYEQEFSVMKHFSD